MIDSLPVVGPISGTPLIFYLTTATFTDSTPGGTWTSSDSTIATVDPVTGLVTGIATGYDTIIYTVSIPGGCSNEATYPFRVWEEGAVKNVNANACSVYPNPSVGTLFIHRTNVAGTATVTIADVTGKTVYCTSLVDNVVESRLDISTLSTGIYLLAIQSGDTYYTGKLEVSK